jgi:hypothetical protein
MAMRAALLAKKQAVAKSTSTEMSQHLLDSNSPHSNQAGYELRGKTQGGTDQSSEDHPYVAFSDRGSTTSSKKATAVATTKMTEDYRWDLCIVVPNPFFEGNNELFKNRKVEQESYEGIMERLHLAGLQTVTFLSGDGDEIYIKIRASLARLQRQAQVMELEMLMNPLYLRDHVDNQTAKIRDDPTLTSLMPYQYIYGKYDAGEQLAEFDN